MKVIGWAAVKAGAVGNRDMAADNITLKKAQISEVCLSPESYFVANHSRWRNYHSCALDWFKRLYFPDHLWSTTAVAGRFLPAQLG